MRLANLSGRAVIVTDMGFIDINRASAGLFSSEIGDAIRRIDEIENWFIESRPSETEQQDVGASQFDERLGPISPDPRQIFVVGLNYRRHAEEMGLPIPKHPMVFTKFASSLTGPNGDLPIPSLTTDFETELVVVFKKGGRLINKDDALSFVAGYCVAQDISERTLQAEGSPAQFSLAKSYRNFSPMGPWLTSTSAVPEPNNLIIGCTINGVTMQEASTSDMIFSISDLISYLSSIVEILPGDLMFTGSPHGVGQGRKPPRFLQPGDVIVSHLESVGSFRTTCIVG